MFYIECKKSFETIDLKKGYCPGELCKSWQDTLYKKHDEKCIKVNMRGGSIIRVVCSGWVNHTSFSRVTHLNSILNHDPYFHD